VDDRVQAKAMGAVRVKGKEEEVEVYEVIGLSA
jgi:class 3 adenylate cyclase